MPTKKSEVYLPNDNRYDKPFKYLRRHDAYLVTLQTQTAHRPELLDVVPGHGDRALPKGLILRWRGYPNYRAFTYRPGHAGDVNNVVELGEAGSLDEVVQAIVNS
jgi:hypothetical protein